MSSRVLRHLAETLRIHGGLTIMTLMVLTATFTVVGSLLLAGQNLTRVLTLWGESMQMTVYLKDEATDEEAEGLGRLLRGDRRVGEAKWIDREAALVSFQEQMATYAPDLLGDAELLKYIPRSFQVKLSETVSSALQFETLRTLAGELKGIATVDDVSFGQDWVKSYSSLTGALTDAGAWLIALLLCGSVLVISNVVSGSIHQRRAEIEVLELVGASKRFIRTPFLVEGAVLGLAAGAFSLALLAGGFHALREVFETRLSFLQLAHHLTFFTAAKAGLFVSVTALIGLASSFFSLRRLNTGWAASRSGKGEG